MAMGLKFEMKAEFLEALSGAQADLSHLAISSDAAVDSVSHTFKALAGHADTLLKQAAAIVGCVEHEDTATVLAQLQSLCAAVKQFLERRLEAASSIVETLRVEEKMLIELTRLTHRQMTIARCFKALSVLTNIEVAHLGAVGEGFHLLANELSAFSLSVSTQTLELASLTENRKQTIARTKRDLVANLPQLRIEMTAMEAEIGKPLQIIDAGLNQLETVPEQFRACAEETARQISGVVAAIQAHDITRQQIEHVGRALQTIASKITLGESQNGDGLPLAHAGLTIQMWQLRTIKETVMSWTSQINRCMSEIQKLSTSQIVSIGPMVLNQERELSSQLANIDLLRQQSQDFGRRIQDTLGGLSSLLELVNEHLESSQNIRDSLHLLSINSMIEADRLRQQGAVVSAIANLIKNVSSEWNVITDESEAALAEILKLVNHTTEVMDVFSDANCQKLAEGQKQTKAALNNVRDAAAFVGRTAEQMQSVTQLMQSNLSGVGGSGNHIEGCFAHLDTVRSRLEAMARALEEKDRGILARYDTSEAERLFSEFYTTEMERDVMRAAIRGAPPPVLQQTFAGNDVELF